MTENLDNQMKWRLAVTCPRLGAEVAGDNIELTTASGDETLTAFFSTRADAEAAAQLMLTAYHGQGFEIRITEVPPAADAPPVPSPH